MRESISLLLILLFISTIFAKDTLQCYKDGMADALLEIDRREYVFETYQKWESMGYDTSLLAEDFDWVFRDGQGKLLLDADLLDKVGLEDAAERMRESYRAEKKKGTYRFIIGVPLGIAMGIAGGLWLDENLAQEEPSNLDMTGSIVLCGSGVGVTALALKSFITTRSVRPDEHIITQLVDLR